MKAPDIIRKAADLVVGERNEQHGDIAKGFELTAALWTDYLGKAEITPTMVADMLELLKISRRRTGAFSLDNYVDGAGYAGIAGQLAAPPEPKFEFKRTEFSLQQAMSMLWPETSRDEVGPVEAFERAWTGGALRREQDDETGAIKIRDLATNQIVFELD